MSTRRNVNLSTKINNASNPSRLEFQSNDMLNNKASDVSSIEENANQNQESFLNNPKFD